VGVELDSFFFLFPLFIFAARNKEGTGVKPGGKGHLVAVAKGAEVGKGVGAGISWIKFLLLFPWAKTPPVVRAINITNPAANDLFM